MVATFSAARLRQAFFSSLSWKDPLTLKLITRIGCSFTRGSRCSLAGESLRVWSGSGYSPDFDDVWPTGSPASWRRMISCICCFSTFWSWAMISWTCCLSSR